MTQLPIGKDWFEIQDMDNGITRIRERYIDPAIACNIWFIRGEERNLFFDSGTGLSSLKQKFPSFFDKPHICVISHTHFDHFGGCYQFEERKMHAAELDVAKQPTRINTTIEGYFDISLFTALPFSSFEPIKYSVNVAEPTGLLKDGDIIDLGNRTLTVLHLPGHSPGLIGLFEPDKQIMFPSDSIYNGQLYDNLYHSNIPDYINSLRRLLTLSISQVHPGHYDSFSQEQLHTLIHDYLESNPVCNN